MTVRSDGRGRARALILSQYDLPANKRNMNAYQRVFHGAEHAEITLLLRKGKEASAAIRERVRVENAPVSNRWLFLLWAVVRAGVLRFRGVRTIFIEPSGFAVVGFLAKILFGYRWVLDVWDRPRWRTGGHEAGRRPSLSDRVVFAMMRRADVILLSVLPRAAKDIDPDPARCVRLCNAIDLSERAAAPPRRHPADPTLHLAYGRSEFQETMGVDVVVRAVEILAERAVPAVVHLVGGMSDESVARIRASRAASAFRVHGFIPGTRASFFRTVHVGLVPYLAFEDLSHIFPIKVIEHLSQGNPVIASRVPGLCEIVKDGGNGLVVEPGDPVALADAVERLQKDRGLYDRLAANALESSLLYDSGEKNRTIFQTLFPEKAT